MDLPTAQEKHIFYFDLIKDFCQKNWRNYALQLNLNCNLI